MPAEPVMGENVSLSTEGCPDDKVCLSIDGAAELRDYLAEDKFWRRQAKKLCGQEENPQ